MVGRVILPDAMLELFQAEDCPYCQKVRTALTELGVSYVIHNPRTATKHDTRNEQTQDELVALGKKDQLPFLVDQARGVMLYESGDIIDYLAQHYAEVGS